MRLIEDGKFTEDPNAVVSLDLMNENDRKQMEKLCYALGNGVRLDIMTFMQRDPCVFSVASMVKELGIPTTTLLFHLEKLQAARLVTILYKQTSRGTQRFVARSLHGANLNFYRFWHAAPTKSKETYALGVGRFCDFTGDTFNFCTDKTAFHSPNSNSFCYMPERFDAQLIYTDRGRVTYRFGNLPAKKHSISEIALSLEICSEAPYYDNNYKSDITFWINGKEIITYTCPGDFGDRRGQLNPDWWHDENTQYGELLTVSVNENGISINGKHVSSAVTVKKLNLDKNNYTEITFGNKDTALNSGGFNVFGRMFGDHPQDICLTYYYINEPKSDE